MTEDFFKRIEAQYKNQLPFVVYRKPKASQLTTILQKNDDLHFAEDFTENGFVFSPFDDTEATVLIPLQESEYIKFVPNNLNPNESGIDFNSEKASSQLKHHHINLVKKGIEAVKKTELEKVVLSRMETVALSEKNPISLFIKLLSKYTSAFVYCWYHPKIGLWLGATPETLIKFEGNHFSMMALAGTQDYKGTEGVVWQDKEKKEQQIVTDFITESIKPFVKNVQVSEKETVKAGNLLHLKTIISARLNPEVSNLKDIIFSLHPTPAVCGLPKQDAKKFILDHENYNRGFYTGFLGELNFGNKIAPRSSHKNIENRAYSYTKKHTQLYVNLRCMQLQGNNANIFIGGGITQTSNPEAEWEETVSKSMIIKSVL